MTLIIIFIVTIFFSGLIVPALLGPIELPFLPVFLLSIVIFSQKIKEGLIKSLIVGFMIEIFFGYNIGSIMVPILMVTILYFWLKKFTDIGSILEKSIGKLAILGQSIFLLIISYIYFFLFILYQATYNIVLTWERFNLLLNTNMIISTFVLVIIYSFIFKQYVVGKTKYRI